MQKNITNYIIILCNMQYMPLCICYMTVYISMLNQCSSALVQFGVKLHVIYHNELHFYIPYHITKYVINMLVHNIVCQLADYT